MNTYHEKLGTRMVRHLREGDEVRCALGDGCEEWRAVLAVIRTLGKGAPAFVRFAAPEVPDGFVDVQLDEEMVVQCHPAEPRHLTVIDGGAS